ncbi:MAG TPA: TMEM175 family protein [Candidatus Sulfotelmatobacter sp.]|nr:TMEM175 family protein [Candidatus Sulfotelmatobacter sp.]
MSKGRLEAFSDGVIAIIITIMVLELAAPRSPLPADLLPLVPKLLCYGLSFLFLGIYWSNHHHLLQAVTTVSGGVLWANLHLLFWLSLVPFVTAWMGENRFAPWPVAVYGAVLLLAAIAYYVLARVLVGLHGSESTIARALGADIKGRISIVIYVAAIGLSLASAIGACLLYLAVALLWLVPDRRIERALGPRQDRGPLP